MYTLVSTRKLMCPSMLAKDVETINNKQAATMAYKINKTQPQRA